MSDLRGGCPLAAACVKRFVAACPRLAHHRSPSLPLACARATVLNHWVRRLSWPGISDGRRIHGRHRTPGLTGLVQPVPVAGSAHGAARAGLLRETPGGFLLLAAFC